MFKKFKNKNKKHDNSFSDSDEDDHSPMKGEAKAGVKAAGSKEKLTDLEGWLRLDLVKGKSLIKSDLIGKSDPYAVIKFGKHVEKTHVINNTQDPQWDFTKEFQVPDGDAKVVRIEVYDSDNLGKDTSLGWLELDLAILVAGFRGKWFKLQGVKSGEIQLNAEMIPGQHNKEKRGSLANIKDMFGTKKQEDKQKKAAPVVATSVRPRTGSSSDDETKKRDSLPRANPSPSAADKPTPPKRKSPSASSASSASSAATTTTPSKSGPLEGRLVVELFGARSLIKADMIGKSDPYAVLKLGNQTAKTKTVNNSLEPRWDFKHEFVVTKESGQLLSIDVFDSDTLGKDKSLGWAEVEVGPGGIPEGWLLLQGTKSGEILLRATFTPPATPPLLKKVEMAPLSQPPSSPKVGAMWVLCVDLLKAENLMKKDLLGKSDPYAVLKFGSQVVRTSTVKNTQEPEWNFSHDFNIPDGDAKTFSIEVFDSDSLGKDTSLGKVDFDVFSIKNFKKKWIPLQNVKSGELLLTLDLVPQGPVKPAPIQHKKEPAAQSVPNGLLRIDLVKAIKLVKSDLLGKSDPYAVLQYGTQVVKTSTINNTQEPQWNFLHSFHVPEGDAKTLSIEVFDDDLGKDKSLGRVALDIAMLKSINSTQWFTLQGVKSGEILLHSSFVAQEVAKPTNMTAKTAEGMLCVDLIKAAKLANADVIGKSDPYAVLKFGHQTAKTRVIKNSQEPVWNLSYDFRIPDGESKILSIEVFDHDEGGKDKSLGRTEVDINSLVEPIKTKWMPLQGAKTGEVLLNVELIPLAAYEAMLAQQQSEQMLCVDLIRAEDLVKSDLLGKSDPYAVLTFGKQTGKSKTIMNTQAPTWNWSKDFHVPDGNASLLTIEVMDKDKVGKDTSLGKVEVNLVDLRGVKGKWLPLQGVKSGKVLINSNIVPLAVYDSVKRKTLAPLGQKQRSRASSVSSLSSTSSSDSERVQDPHIKSLNNRLVGYIDKVRLMQQASDVWKGGPQVEDRSGDLEEYKRRYEEELEKWKQELEKAEKEAAKSRIEADRLEKETKHVRDLLEDKNKQVKGRDDRIAELEKEIADILGRNNILLNEKERMKEHEKELGKELAGLKEDLEEARKDLAEEKVGNGVLTGRLELLRKEMETKLAMLEAQLEAERRRNKLDFSNLDDKIRSEYAKRLRSELRRLRRQYQEQTEISKREFMNVHSKRIAELQESLSKERTDNSSARSELQEALARIQQFKDKIVALETANHGLGLRSAELQHLMEEKEATFNAKMGAKQGEIKHLQDEVGHVRRDYETVLEEKLALDTEIAVYRGLIEAEERRLARSSRKDKKSSGKQNGKKKSGSSSSESEKDESGFFEKIKDKIAG